MVIGDYKRNWEDAIKFYKNKPLEYGPLDILWKLARFEGSDIKRTTFFALSGFGLNFFYNLDKYWLYEKEKDYYLENALELAGLEFEILKPKDVNHAVEIIEEKTNLARPLYMSWVEPLLVFGFEGTIDRPGIHWHSDVFAPDGKTWGRDEMEDSWWNMLSEEDERRFITITGKKPRQDSIEVFIEIMSHFYEEVETEEKGSYYGIAAYDAFIKDILDNTVEFRVVDRETGVNRLVWFDFATYSQWTQLYAMSDFIRSNADGFTGNQKVLLMDSSALLLLAYEEWMNWHRVIGRLSDEKMFLGRLADMEIRYNSAVYIQKAKENLVAAIELITKFNQQNSN